MVKCFARAVFLTLLTNPTPTAATVAIKGVSSPEAARRAS
jgi:hypothetical protein